MSNKQSLIGFEKFIEFGDELTSFVRLTCMNFVNAPLSIDPLLRSDML